MERNWKIIARDALGNETLLKFCPDMAEGKKLMAQLASDKKLANFNGEMALKPVNPEWITNPVTSDYSHYVRSLIPDSQWLESTGVDEPTAFYNLNIGNMKEYYMLAMIIPKSFTIIDFGCNTNAQSYLFINHNKYIGVDTKKDMFRAPGTAFYMMTAGEFIKNELSKLQLNMQRTFAICSNVTGKNYENPGMLVRMNFLNMFTINNFKSINGNDKNQ